jgi:tetratricopeptide (TPR) repeat protein
MRSVASCLFSALLVSLISACSPPEPDVEVTGERRAPLLEGMGEYRFPTTIRDQARRYLDQGMVLAWGFNHAESERSFLEAARLDPDCAICYWGAALVLGPNINAAMDPDDAGRAWASLQEAVARSSRASERERDLIAALGKRYSEGPPPEDRSALDLAYAEAMGALAAKYSADADIQTLYAEALMNLHPWDFWLRDGSAQPWTAEILRVLDSALEIDENHPGANHLRIHALEASKEPARAIVNADRLASLAPGAGHLVHMPAHIYIRTGRYEDAIEANRAAIRADDAYVTQCHAQGVYPLAYMPHNHHFLLAATTFEGRKRESYEAADHISHTDETMMRQPGLGTLQHFRTMPLYTMVRFSDWDSILTEPAPAADLIYPTGVWHYARGMAFVATGRLDDAEAALDQLQTTAGDPALDSVTIWDLNGTRDLLAIAERILASRIAFARGNRSSGIEALERAVELEDALTYDEPPAWPFPVRTILGAAYLDAGDPHRAEKVYLEDLGMYPENGWSLHGLTESLRLQGREEEAAATAARLQKAWARADVRLVSSWEVAAVESGAGASKHAAKHGRVF